MATKQTDYVALTAKYTKNVNADAVHAIVKYCGVALRSRDASYVAATDKSELERIVKGFCAKKLGLDRATATAAVAAVAAKMKASRMKHRVPFYYLLAEHTGKLNLMLVKATSKKAAAKTSSSAATMSMGAKPTAAPTAASHSTMQSGHSSTGMSSVSGASASMASTKPLLTPTAPAAITNAASQMGNVGSAMASSAKSMTPAPMGLWARIMAWFN